MPLNRVMGEQIESLPSSWTVVPIEKWASLGGIVETAAQYAADQFADAGSPKPVIFGPEDILVQEYHETGQVVLVFQREVRGQEMYSWYCYDLPDDMVRELQVNGQWPEGKTKKDPA